MINGVLLDLAGVVYDGDRAIPGAAEAVSHLREEGLPIRFVSNTTRSTKQAILERLADFGVTAARDELFTPAAAARQWLQERGYSPFLLVHPRLEADFADLPGGAGRAVVVGDAGEALDYARLNAAYRQLEEGAEFLALANNRIFRDVDGRPSLDAGPFVAALEFASRRRAIVVGKPSARFFRLALASMRCAPERAVMVGDDAESDVAGALRAKVGHALLVRTGKYRPGDEVRCRPRPTATVDDLAAAVEWILKRKNAGQARSA